MKGSGSTRAYVGQGKPDPDRKGGWVLTYSKRRFWPLDPRPEEVHLVDIAHQLSLQCRFNGALESMYSVAEHSVRVAGVVSDLGGSLEDQMCALFHDAAETWLSDVARPIKEEGGELGKLLKQIEEPMLEAVALHFGLQWPFPEVVWKADDILLATEERDLRGNGILHEWLDGCTVLDEEIVPLDSSQAEVSFLSLYDILAAKREITLGEKYV